MGTPAQNVRKATAPCRHIGLFMGKAILEDVWPKIVRWLGELPIVAPEHWDAQAVERMH